MSDSKKRQYLDLFYTVYDIAEMCGISQNTAYIKIKELNKRLEEQGYIVPKSGQVLKTWADKWLFMKEA